MIGSSCGAGAGLPPNPTTTSAVVVATGVAPQLGAGSTAVVVGALPNPPGVGTAEGVPNPPGAGVPNADEPNAGGVTVEPTFPNPPKDRKSVV